MKKKSQSNFLAIAVERVSFAKKRRFIRKYDVILILLTYT